MTRTTSGVTTRARHKKILKLAKGFRGRAKNCYRTAIQRVEKSLQYAYRDRRTRKRSLRALWIQRINAAARLFETTYSKLINALIKSGIEIDRKMLSEMAVNNPQEFENIIIQVKQHL